MLYRPRISTGAPVVNKKKDDLPVEDVFSPGKQHEAIHAERPI